MAERKTSAQTNKRRRRKPAWQTLRYAREAGGRLEAAAGDVRQRFFTHPAEALKSFLVIAWCVFGLALEFLIELPFLIAFLATRCANRDG
jgi:hypothetical protein